MFELDTDKQGPRIRVVGIGGCGGNAINSIAKRGIHGVDLISMNTDMQDLERSVAPNKIQIGKSTTRGLGAGANPETGRRAAIEAREEIYRALKDSDMVFITAGMGGGTGTGAAPIVASILKGVDRDEVKKDGQEEQTPLIVAVVTKPFVNEAKERMRNADAGIEELKKYVDALIVIPNEKLLTISDKSAGYLASLQKIYDVLYDAIRGISEIITKPGFVNVDFADVRTVLASRGDAIIGTGIAGGDRRAAEAASAAISNPLLEEVSLERVEGILVSITAGTSFGLHEYDEIVKTVRGVAKNGDEETKVIVGVSIDEKMEKDVIVTVIAAGLNSRPQPLPNPTPDPRKRFTLKDKEKSKDQSWSIKDWRSFDEPTFERNGINIHLNKLDDAEAPDEAPAPKPGERPAFLRKVMD
ncbi:MAG TPA: cell division protein FtsZ [Candidatus Kryptobacter bacterium]|nr:MAG: cell division protein FtsZ [Ignavibacteriae bacterium 37-53-5]HQT90459.1 cell division protein FtsZ [Candidatus Kryptobacter bacterium]